MTAETAQPSLFYTIGHLLLGHAITGLITTVVLVKTAAWPKLAVSATLVTAVSLGWLTVSTVGVGNKTAMINN